MKKLLLLLLISSFSLFAFPRKSIVERYTNASCAPCASLNNSWYTNTLHGIVAENTATHIVYNVNWPGANDPMYLLNAQDNAVRWGYYGVNAVPWVTVNGTTINTSSSSTLLNAVANGNNETSPFKIKLTPERFSNNIINVKVTVFRDASDTVSSYTKTRLRVILTEKTVSYASPPGSNGERVFYCIARKSLPDGKGTLLEVPVQGDSLTYNFQFLPSAAWTQTVNLDSIRVAAFIQDDNTKFIYQAVNEDLVSSTSINSAFMVDQDLIASNTTVSFTDYSVGANSNSITSWKWDFNNDGIIDATIKNPTYKYTQKGKFTVSLEVSDGTNSMKRTVPNQIEVIGKTADILVVNGIDVYYGAEVNNFYAASACFGDHDVDIWDVFGDQGVNYSANPKIKQLNLYNKKVPVSVMKLYDKVIWIGNNYTGDLAYFDQQQVVDYVKLGGNFILATRQGSLFLNGVLSTYCGITGYSGDVTLTQITPLDTHLVSMTAVGVNSLVNYVVVDTFSYVKPLFDDDASTLFLAGIRVNKPGDGNFIFIAGRPYRYDAAASFANYNYIIDNMMNGHISAVEDKESGVTPSDFALMQNYPNPFNPSTTIKYSLPVESNVKISIFNTLGELIAVPVNSFNQTGVHSITFNTNGLSSGVYIYTIQATSEDGRSVWINSKKMVVLK